MERPKLVFGLTVPFSTILVGNLFSELIDSGWDVHLVLGEAIPEPFHVDSRVVTHVIPMHRRISPFSDLVAIYRWVRLLRTLQPRVCIGATPKAGMISMLSARMAQVPHRVFQVWGAKWDGVSGVKGWLLRSADTLAVNSATITIACSRSLADLMLASGVCNSSPLVLGYGGTKGVDILEFHPETSSEFARKNPSIGFVGRIAHDKGIETLTTVFKSVKRLVPNAELTIVGPIDDTNPVPPEVLKSMTDDPQIHILGHRSDVASLMRSFDVMCFPSAREGLPNVVIEAAASGVPVVAWAVTGCIDAISNGETGYIIPFGDKESMSLRISELVTNKQLNLQMSANARQFAVERFDSRTVIGLQVRQMQDFVRDIH